MNARELAVRLAQVKFVKDITTAEEARVKTALASVLDPGDRKTATLDGADVGTVTYSKSSTVSRLVVVDEAALIKWLTKHQPDALVTRVADWWVPEATAAVEAGGEIPPGTDYLTTTKPGYVSARQSDAQKAALMARSDLLTTTLTQIAGGTE